MKRFRCKSALVLFRLLAWCGFVACETKTSNSEVGLDASTWGIDASDAAGEYSDAQSLDAGRFDIGMDGASENPRWVLRDLRSSFENSSTFATALAISGDGNFLAVGDPEGGIGQSGAVSLFRWNNGRWLPEGNLPEPVDSVDFGGALSMSENGYAIGAVDPQRSILLYRRTSLERWNPIPLMIPRDGVRFGHEISISGGGSRMMVPSDDLNGQVWLYRTTDMGTFFEDILFQPEDGESNGCVGELTNDGSQFVLGSIYPTDSSLALFHFGAQGWTSNKLFVGDPEGPQQLRGAAKISGDGDVIAFAESESQFPGTNVPGRVTMFQRENGVWSNNATLRASSRCSHSSASRFGETISLSRAGNALAIGVPRGGSSAGSAEDGCVYTYRRQNGQWFEEDPLPVPADAAMLGTRIVQSNDGMRVVVAFQQKRIGAASIGAIATYEWR